MKILADENLFEPMIEYLRSMGHDVLSIREMGLSGISDDEVYKQACRGKYITITMDKDFSRMIRFQPQKCGGIIVVKIYKRTVDETLMIFKRFFEKLQGKDIYENLVIISPEGIRIKRGKF